MHWGICHRSLTYQLMLVVVESALLLCSVIVIGGVVKLSGTRPIIKEILVNSVRIPISHTDCG